MNRQTLSQREKLSRRANPEAALHRAVAAYLRLALRPPTIWTTIGHGGGGRVRGAQLKAMGVQPGWPDIIILNACGNAPFYVEVVGIELKSATGSLSAEQKAIASAFKTAGAWYGVAYDVGQVETILRQFNIPVHASVLGLLSNGTIAKQGKVRQSHDL